MGAGDVAGDGKAKTNAARLQVAAFVEAVKGPECFLALTFRNARPVIGNEDPGHSALDSCGKGDLGNLL